MITILIVEDLEQDRKLYKRILSGMDARILEAESGEIAIDLLRRETVDVFFLDIELPGIDGFKLANKIRHMEGYAMTPILFLTGMDKRVLEAFHNFHCYDYIVKPFDGKNLTERILKLMEDYKNAQHFMSQKKHKKIQLVTNEGFCLVSTDQIIFAESHRMSCTVHLHEGTLHLPRMSLAKVIKEIDEDFFVRCHKSFAVNVCYITSVGKFHNRLAQIYMKYCEKTVDYSETFKRQVEAAIQHDLSKGGRYNGV